MKNDCTRRALSLLLALLLLAALPAGQGRFARAQEAAPVINESLESETQTLQTVSGREISRNDPLLILSEALGLGVLCPEAWNRYANGQVIFFLLEDGLQADFCPPQVLAALRALSGGETAGMSQEELEAALTQRAPLMKLFMTVQGTGEEDVLARADGYDSCEKIADYEGQSAYLALRGVPEEGEYPWLSAEERAALLEAAEVADELAQNVVLFPPVKDEGAYASFRLFEAHDLDGATVTEQVFAGYDLTLVNIWATWCGPCVSELPALAELARSLPENMNLITLCADAWESPEDARELLEACGATFLTLAGTPEMDNTLLSDLYAFPTTLFLDRQGRLVGDAVLGARSAEEYEALLQERLALVQAEGGH